MDTTLFQRQNNKLKSENIIYCLEFLARDAMDNELPCIHDIIKTSITEIVKRDNAHINSEYDTTYYDILNAFRSFAKFCLIKDDNTRKQAIEFLENIDESTLLVYENSSNHIG
ncbi:MAG: hypothetical protein R3D71_10195 [Rickettsiales bacterium]